MAAFRDTQDAREVLGGFFRQEAADENHLFAGSGLVIGWNVHDPSVHVILDLTKPAQPGKAFDVYVDDPAAPAPTVDIAISADDFDKLFKGEVQPMSLIMTGKAKASGDYTQAMRLLPALSSQIPRYKKYRQ